MGLKSAVSEPPSLGPRSTFTACATLFPTVACLLNTGKKRILWTVCQILINVLPNAHVVKQKRSVGVQRANIHINIWMLKKIDKEQEFLP